MRLQGQSTLTEEEKITEATFHLKRLVPLVEEMNGVEKAFVLKKAAYIRCGMKLEVSNRELYWLRDLTLKF